MRKHTQHVITVAIVLGVIAIGAAAFAWSGLYNIAADDQHTRPVYAMLTTFRERSIAARVKDLQLPDVTAPASNSQGAGKHNARCTGRHLATGMEQPERDQGRYTPRPTLATHQNEQTLQLTVT